MDGGGVGKHKLIEFMEEVGDDFLVKFDEDFARFSIYFYKASNISVEHLFGIVIANLHHFVTRAKACLPIHEKLFLGIEVLLEGGVEQVNAAASSFHGGKHLDFMERIKARAQAFANKVNNGACHLFRFLSFDEKEIAALVIGKLGQDACIDVVSIGDDFGAGCLSVDFVEGGDSCFLGGDQIVEDGAGANAWKLIDIAYKDNARMGGDCFE